MAALSKPIVRTRPIAPGLRPRRSRWSPISTAARPKPKARNSRAARMRPKSRDIRATSTPRELVALTPGIERVVHRTLQPDLLVVLLAMQQGETAGDGAQACRFGRDPDVGGHIGSVNDAGELGEGRVLQVVLQDDGLEAAAPVHMT